jgi:MYXO-CTERM domain-containing protein
VRRRVHLSVAVSLAALCATSTAYANRIQDENAKPVDPTKDSWEPKYDSNYQALNIGVDGTIDGYPSHWSYKLGDTLGLRVSTTAASFRTRVYRIGWYGGLGSRLVWEAPSTPGERQPFPPQNADTGLAEANWHDSVTVAIGGDWVPGEYAVRFTTDGGMEGYTYFTLRDDGSGAHAPILMVDTLTTAFAYNPWPKILDSSGKQIQGKSLYQYNSAGVTVNASGDREAVAVSFDRPHGENWGLGIWRDWTVPMVQFLEQKGYDVAYATSLDLHDGAVLAGRKVWMDSGHDEYWTRAMWDNLYAARGQGLNLAWFSGNDLSWQVRLEAGSGGPTSTMIGYKIAAYPDEGRCGTCWAYGGDPEFQLALKAKQAGDTTNQILHLKNVTYAWAGLKDWDPNAPSPTFPGQRGAPLQPPAPIARSGMSIEGLDNGPKLPSCPSGAALDNPCYGITWVVDAADHWIYTGQGVSGGIATGLANGDRIPMIVGYEMDNARVGQDISVRPQTQVVLGHTDSVFTPASGSAENFSGLFNAQYYEAKNGARVFAAGTINWPWGLDRPGVGQWGGIKLNTPVAGRTTIAAVISAMTINVLNKLLEGPGTPWDGDAGVPPSGDATAGGPDAGASTQQVGDTKGTGGCSVRGAPGDDARDLALIFGAVGLAIAIGRRRRA